jgi:hypothetical protein
MLSVIMLSFIMLSVIMLSVFILLSVVMLNVVASLAYLNHYQIENFLIIQKYCAICYIYFKLLFLHVIIIKYIFTQMLLVNDLS